MKKRAYLFDDTGRRYNFGSFIRPSTVIRVEPVIFIENLDQITEESKITAPGISIEVEDYIEARKKVIHDSGSLVEGSMELPIIKFKPSTVIITEVIF